MFVLRDYQQVLVDELLCSSDNVLVQLFPRAGKTVIIDAVVRHYKALGVESIILAHSILLVEQLKKNLPAGTYVFTWQSFILSSWKPNNDKYILIVDEAHRSCGASYLQIFERLQSLRRIGFTGTPIRVDKLSISSDLGGLQKNKAPFSRTICGPSVAELIKEGHISDFTYYNNCYIDRKQLDEDGGLSSTDYSATVVHKYVDAEKMALALKDECLDGCGKGLIFCADIKHVETCTAVLEELGILYGTAHSMMNPHEVASIMSRFEHNDCKYIVSCNMLNEGLNFPFVDNIIMFRPTKSLSMYLQQVFRPLQPSLDKQVVILDAVGNMLAHRHPSEERDWKRLTQSVAKLKAEERQKILQLKQDRRKKLIELRLQKVQRLPAVRIKDNIYFADGSFVFKSADHSAKIKNDTSACCVAKPDAIATRYKEGSVAIFSPETAEEKIDIAKGLIANIVSKLTFVVRGVENGQNVQHTVSFDKKPTINMLLRDSKKLRRFEFSKRLSYKQEDRIAKFYEPISLFKAHSSVLKQATTGKKELFDAVERLLALH